MAFVVFVVSVSVLVFGIESQPYPQQSPHQSYGVESGGYGGGHGQATGGGGGYSSNSGSSDGSYQTETKYYYGGKYGGITVIFK